jgi:hypothetical protein
MSLKHFSPAPEEAKLSFGGFSFIHPEYWDNYLNEVIREDFPDYFAALGSGRWNSDQWKEKESCILNSLVDCLFHQFGVRIPERNLFQVYNKEGEGLELSNLLEAISAVIEPLGLEIDRVLAVDPEIRAALGEGEKVIGEDQAGAVEGKPGLCMINVKQGYSHAFFWRKIDRRGFKNERFRMVVVVKKIAEDRVPQLSAVESLKSFLHFFQDRFSLNDRRLESEYGFFEKIQADIRVLEKDAQDFRVNGDGETRIKIDQHLACLLDDYRQYSDRLKPAGAQQVGQFRVLFEAGQMVRKVVSESETFF